jgi:hypothetical protein
MARITFTPSHLEAFARVWPGFRSDPDSDLAPLSFEFDSGGDLVDVEGDSGLDESAVLALSHDAQALAGLEARGASDLAWLPPSLPRPALAPVWRLYARSRPYACQCCGHVQPITTNHTGPLSADCPGCNARGLELPTTGHAPYAGHFPRPLTYAGPPVQPDEYNPHADNAAARLPFGNE